MNIQISTSGRTLHQCVYAKPYCSRPVKLTNVLCCSRIQLYRISTMDCLQTSKMRLQGSCCGCCLTQLLTCAEAYRCVWCDGQQVLWVQRWLTSRWQLFIWACITLAQQVCQIWRCQSPEVIRTYIANCRHHLVYSMCDAEPNNSKN